MRGGEEGWRCGVRGGRGVRVGQRGEGSRGTAFSMLITSKQDRNSGLLAVIFYLLERVVTFHPRPLF